MHLLDVGSGIGGPARTFADAFGCRVTGVDLTEEFVEAANALTRRCGLSDRVSFRQASALALPFADASFDAATLIHVGMNIEDKAGLFAEVRRVLKPDARFGVYDIMRVAEGEIPYPMPWAATAGDELRRAAGGLPAAPIRRRLRDRKRGEPPRAGAEDSGARCARTPRSTARRRSACTSSWARRARSASATS